MGVLRVFGIGILAALAALTLLYVRRAAIRRDGGTIAMSVRLSTRVPGRGWAMGLARFTADELEWFRLFSFDPRPRRVLSRSSLSVLGRRAPEPTERITLPERWVVIRCGGDGSTLELALAESALTGFLSWLEAAPPGALRRR